MPRGGYVGKILKIDLTGEKIDIIDLMIVRALQKDIFTPLTRIAEQIGENPKTIRYHYVKHVLGEGIIGKHVVYWIGTSTDKIIRVFITTKRPLNTSSITKLSRTIARIPFTFLDTCSTEGMYISFLRLPVDEYAFMLRYLHRNLGELKKQVNVLIADHTRIRSFTVPFELFDAEKRAWTFDKEKIIDCIQRLIYASGVVPLRQQLDHQGDR